MRRCRSAAWRTGRFSLRWRRGRPFLRGCIPVGDDPDGVELPPDLRWTRTWERWQRGGDSRAALDELEAQWAAVGVSWTDPWSDKLMVAGMISRIPERRARAVELARGAMADLDAVDPAGDPGRPLGQTAREYADVIARARAAALVEYYWLLDVQAVDRGGSAPTAATE